MVSKQKSLAKVNLSSEYDDNHDQNDDYGMVMMMVLGMIMMMMLQEEAPGRSDYSFQYSILDDDTGITHSRYVKWTF